MSDDLNPRVIGLVRMMLLLMAVWVLCWGVTPWKPFFFGLIVGSLASLINALHTAWRVRRFFAWFNRTGRRPRFAAGTALRFGVAILAALVAWRWPQVDLLGTILGLVTAQLLTLIHSLVTLKKSADYNNETGKG